MKEYKIYDMHADIMSHFTLENEINKKSDIFRSYHLNNFKKGNVALSVFTIWNDKQPFQSRERLVELLGIGARELYLARDLINVVENKDNIVNDKINALIGIEGLDSLKCADEIYFLYRYGVRIASLTWNFSNIFASCSADDNDQGLKEEGKKLIKIMNDLGVIIDVSHVSDQSVKDILSITTKPIVASHSNARNIVDIHRNLSDELLKGIAKNNGVIGINVLPFVINENEEEACIDDIVKQIKYIKELIGIDHIGLGFDYCSYLDETEGLTGIVETKDMYNQADNMNLIKALEDDGFSDEEIAKITHLNFERLIKEVI